MRALAIMTTLAALLLCGASHAGPSEQDAGPGPSDDDAGLGALEEEPGLEIDARLAALWSLGDAAEEPRNEFLVNAARLQLTWTQWHLVEASVDLEAKHLLDGSGAFSILRDLYVLVQPLPWLGVRMGQFKKPFSRIALTSRRRLPLIARGAGNDFLVEHLTYGDRDIGLALEGRLVESIELDYSLGVFNGMGPNTAEIAVAGSKDVAARLEAAPARWLSVGASGSLKLVDAGDLPGFADRSSFALVDAEEYPAGYTDGDFVSEHGWMAGAAWAAGADLGLKLGKARVVAEGLYAENWWFERYPHALSGLLMVSYRVRLGEGVPLWLEPVVKGEVIGLLRSSGEWRVRLWQLTPAVNLLIGKHVRLMIDGELIFTEGTEADIDGSRRDGLWPNEWPGEFRDSRRLMVQLSFEV